MCDRRGVGVISFIRKSLLPHSVGFAELRGLHIYVTANQMKANYVSNAETSKQYNGGLDLGQGLSPLYRNCDRAPSFPIKLLQQASRPYRCRFFSQPIQTWFPGVLCFTPHLNHAFPLITSLPLHCNCHTFNHINAVLSMMVIVLHTNTTYIARSKK